jgi:hypothetical protein
MSPALFTGLLLISTFLALTYEQDDADPVPLVRDGVPGVAAPGRLLIDRSHRGDRNISDFTNDLASQGWVIAEHPLGGGPITASILAGYDILLVTVALHADDPMDAWSSSEVEAVRTFLYSGGGALWMLHQNRNPFSANSLAQAFGVNFKYDGIRDSTNYDGVPSQPIIHLLEEHPITEGVSSYRYFNGDCVTSVPPAFIVARADEDAYSLNCPAGTRPPTLVALNFNGRAVFSGDASVLGTRYLELSSEEKRLLMNIADWLISDTPTAVQPTSWGTIKALHAGQ